MCATVTIPKSPSLLCRDTLQWQSQLSLERECVFVRVPRPNTSFQFLFQGLTFLHDGNQFEKVTFPLRYNVIANKMVSLAALLIFTHKRTWKPREGCVKLSNNPLDNETLLLSDMQHFARSSTYAFDIPVPMKSML